MACRAKLVGPSSSFIPRFGFGRQQPAPKLDKTQKPAVLVSCTPRSAGNRKTEPTVPLRFGRQHPGQELDNTLKSVSYTPRSGLKPIRPDNQKLLRKKRLKDAGIFPIRRPLYPSTKLNLDNSSHPKVYEDKNNNNPGNNRMRIPAKAKLCLANVKQETQPLLNKKENKSKIPIWRGQRLSLTEDISTLEQRKKELEHELFNVNQKLNQLRTERVSSRDCNLKLNLSATASPTVKAPAVKKKTLQKSGIPRCLLLLPDVHHVPAPTSPATPVVKCPQLKFDSPFAGVDTPSFTSTDPEQLLPLEQAKLPDNLYDMCRKSCSFMQTPKNSAHLREHSGSANSVSKRVQSQLSQLFLQ